MKQLLTFNSSGVSELPRNWATSIQIGCYRLEAFSFPIVSHSINVHTHTHPSFASVATIKQGELKSRDRGNLPTFTLPLLAQISKVCLPK